MSESVLASSLLLAAVAALAAVGAWALRAVVHRTLRAVLALACLVGAAISIFTVDVNVPLAASHLRPSGEAAPLWMALLAWAFRLLPLCLLVLLASRPPRKASADPAPAKRPGPNGGPTPL